MHIGGPLSFRLVGIWFTSPGDTNQIFSRIDSANCMFITSRKLSGPPICMIKFKKLVKKSKISEKRLSLNSPQPPIWTKIKKKQWKCNQHQIKMNFAAKVFSEKFFCEKSNIPPPPWFSPKNVSRVVIPTENGQTVQFQVLKRLFLSSATWKTTKKTCISII